MMDLPCSACTRGQPGGLRSVVQIEDGRCLPVCDYCFADGRQPQESRIRTLARSIGSAIRGSAIQIGELVHRIRL